MPRSRARKPNVIPREEMTKLIELFGLPHVPRRVQILVIPATFVRGIGPCAAAVGVPERLDALRTLRLEWVGMRVVEALDRVGRDGLVLTGTSRGGEDLALSIGIARKQPVVAFDGRGCLKVSWSTETPLLWAQRRATPSHRVEGLGQMADIFRSQGAEVLPVYSLVDEDVRDEACSLVEWLAARCVVPVETHRWSNALVEKFLDPVAFAEGRGFFDACTPPIPPKS